MDVNRDFIEMLVASNAERVRCPVVGAHAVAYHTEPRYTKDHDIRAEATPVNAARLCRALQRFRAPLTGLTAADFESDQVVYQMGVEPCRSGSMTGVDGLGYSQAWRNRVRIECAGVKIAILCRTDLIQNKRAAGQPRHLLDMQPLRAKPRAVRRKR